MTAGDVLFRSLFVVALAVAAYEPLKEMRPGTDWRPGTPGARIGDQVVTTTGRAGVAAAIAVSGLSFAAGWWIVPALCVFAAAFLLLATVYLAQRFAGYVTEEDDGTKHFKVHHHLHLAGMAVLTAAVAGLAGLVAGHGSDPHVLTAWISQGFWGAVGAHYFVAAISKIRKRGLGWADRRLFPYFVTLFTRYRRGDGETVRDTGAGPLLARHPAWSTAPLWAVLLLELAAPAVMFGYPFRLVIGVGLVLFHACSYWLLAVDFRENAMLAALVLLPLPWPGADWAGLTIAPVALTAGVGCILLSLLFDDRVFPFSNLPMFAAAYRPVTVITLRSPDGALIYPTIRYAGCSTSGLSREFAETQEPGPDLEGFLGTVRDRIARSGEEPPAGTVLWREVIDVDPSGRVHVDDGLLAGLA
ncbi:hypothetical protein [Paractinoplanes atraurantiacus]|uniref:HTTM domain-containing protein n=1 Tax=Paractinoplanes atraurantiacus TaxID=1036182 RepID=A0A285IZV1_9ACTN|nr:hypothetical protein [Actinoplanes atraurantiacus]SNY53590.1 hypothetical protein SAMN05421748_11477 [Actinoplanes atraurantiacus]